MLQKTILTSICLLLLIGLSSQAQATGDSTKIGISVLIKASQQCDYDYSLENLSNSNNNYSRSSSCYVGSFKLQQQLDQVAYSTSKVLNTQIDGKRYRVFMTVQ